MKSKLEHELFEKINYLNIFVNSLSNFKNTFHNFARVNTDRNTNNKKIRSDRNDLFSGLSFFFCEQSKDEKLFRPVEPIVERGEGISKRGKTKGCESKGKMFEEV